MKNFLVLFVMLAVSFFILPSCKKRAIKKADEALYGELSESGYVYYQGGAILPAQGGSPHGPFKLRFNTTAQAALDSTLELPVGSSFPNGSILVKELYSGSSLTLYVVMKKDNSDKYAEKGWLWAEFETDGEVVYSIGEEGGSCTDCHTATPNRDFTRTFDLH